MKKRPYEKPELMGIEALAGGSSSTRSTRGGGGRTCCRRTGHACPTLIKKSFGKRKKNKTVS